MGRRRSRRNLHFELLLKGLSRRTDEVLMTGPDESGPGLDTRRTFAVEFSKTGAASERRRLGCQPGEPALPDLQKRTVERLAGQIELRDGLAVQLHRPLPDQAPRL